MNAGGAAVDDLQVMEERIEAAAQKMRHDPSAARDELEGVVATADAVDEHAVAARGRYLLARTMVSLGSAESALGLIERAEQGWLTVGEVDEALRTNLGRMHVLDELGRHSEAAEVGRALLAALDDHPDRDDHVWLRAAAEENLGVALGYLGRHSEALAAYESAAGCYGQLGAALDAARALANRGVELSELGRPAEAIEALRGARARFEEHGDTLWCALCEINMSEAWITAGRYLEAFNCLDAADEALDGLDHTAEWLRAQLARAQCLESLRLDVEALDLFDSLIGPLRQAQLIDELGKAQLGRGMVLARASTHVDEAGRAFRDAYDAFEVSGDPALLARTCLAESEVADEPMALIERAIDLLADGERPAELALAHLSAARRLEASDPASAADSLATATALAESLGLPTLLGEVARRRGRLDRLAGRLTDAQRAFESAVSIFDDVRRSIDWDGVRPHLDGARRDAADDLVGVLLEGDQLAAALAAGESIRARNLVDRMRHRALPPAEAPITELIATYDRLLRARGPVVDELAKRARQLERRARSPLGSTTERSDRPLELPADTVSFQTVADRVVAFVTDEEGDLVAHELVSIGVIESLLRQLDAHWRRFEHREIAQRHGDQLRAATVDVLRRLYDHLMAPVAEQLSPTGPLTVSPDGLLGAIPFGALHDDERFVIERRAVRQIPSLVVDAIAGERTRPPETVLAIGAADPSAPLASHEAEGIGDVWTSATVRVGAEATASAFVDEAPSHDVVHIAAHGLFRSDVPDFSALRFADRWMTAAELAHVELDGQLVVLSACDSARRSVGPAWREPLGLPRALLAAGAGGVVAHSWPADDRATAELMASFHEALTVGLDPAEALRTAQLLTMNTHPHPYHWAAAVLICGRPSDRVGDVDGAP